VAWVEASAKGQNVAESCPLGNNLDLAFASVDQDNRLPDRRVVGKFPRSQHRPSLITPPRFSAHSHSDPVNRWNFHKVDWKHFCFLRLRDCHLGHIKHREDIQRILQDPAIRGKNYVPRWDKEFDTLYCSFIRAQVATGSGRAASPLSLWLEQKKQQFWQILAF